MTNTTNIGRLAETILEWKNAERVYAFGYGETPSPTALAVVRIGDVSEGGYGFAVIPAEGFGMTLDTMGMVAEDLHGIGVRLGAEEDGDVLVPSYMWMCDPNADISFDLLAAPGEQPFMADGLDWNPPLRRGVGRLILDMSASLEESFRKGSAE